MYSKKLERRGDEGQTLALALYSPLLSRSSSSRDSFAGTKSSFTVPPVSMSFLRGRESSLKTRLDPRLRGDDNLVIQLDPRLRGDDTECVRAKGLDPVVKPRDDGFPLEEAVIKSRDEGLDPVVKPRDDGLFLKGERGVREITFHLSPCGRGRPERAGEGYNGVSQLFYRWNEIEYSLYYQLIKVWLIRSRKVILKPLTRSVAATSPTRGEVTIVPFERPRRFINARGINYQGIPTR